MSFFFVSAKSSIHLCEFGFPYRPQFRSQTIAVRWDAARAAHRNPVRACKPNQRMAVNFDGHRLSMSVLSPLKAQTAQYSHF